MLRSRLADLSLQTIVIAVLAVLVLVVLISIFMQGTTNFTGGVRSCPGVCADSPSGCPANSIPQKVKCTESSATYDYCCIAQP
jgi:hypothetical protein